MNKILIFFLIVFTIYIGTHFYVFMRGLQAFEFKSPTYYLYLIGFMLLSSLYILGILLENVLPVRIINDLQSIGGTWMFAILYLTAFCFVLDLIRFSNYVFPWYPTSLIQNYSMVKKYIAIGASGVLAITFIWSSFRFNDIKVEKIGIDTGKNKESIQLVMVSDVHLGYTITKKRLQTFVKLINEQNPDLVLIAGDLIDRSVHPLLEENMYQELSMLKPRLGVYTILGNHEYIKNVKESVEYIQNSNITLLRDTSVMVNQDITVIGRDDRMNPKRKSLKTLMEGVEKETITILLDHQPFNLEEAQIAGINLQLSGHTHHGQMWPINIITNMIFELSFGYLKKGNTHYYVSSGLGIWGPRLRLGTQSEIVVITLK